MYGGQLWLGGLYLYIGYLVYSEWVVVKDIDFYLFLVYFISVVCVDKVFVLVEVLDFLLKKF